MEHKLFNDWRESVISSPTQPRPVILEENEKFKLIVSSLEPGQNIPVHPEGSAVYHILEGNGWMTVDEDRLPIQAGSTITMEDGAARGIEAQTKLAFLAVRIA